MRSNLNFLKILNNPVLANRRLTLNQNEIQFEQNNATHLNVGRNMTRLIPCLVALIAAAFALTTPDDPAQKELGAVNWQRDYESAKKSSVQSGKPLMVFFQEVPG